MKWLALILVLLSHVVGAQTDDILASFSLLNQRLDNEKDKAVRLSLLSQLFDVAFSINLDTALNYAEQGLRLSLDVQDKKWEPVFYEAKGRTLSFLLEFDSAKASLTKGIKSYSAIDNKRGEAASLLKLAWTQKRSGEKEKAMESDLAALRIMEKLNDTEGIALAYERISDGLTRQERWDEALDYGLKSVDLCEKNGFEKQLCYSWFNMGNVYIAKHENPDALRYYDLAVKSGHRLKLDPVSQIHAIVGRGNALKRLTRYDEALKDYNFVLTFATRVNYVNAISVAIANLGEVNLLRGNYKEALKYQLETVRLQEKNHNLTNLVENYQHVSTIYEKLGSYTQALAYQKKAMKMRDSVASIESDAAMSKLLTQYQAEKREATITSQQDQLAQQKKVQWLIIGIAISLGGILLIGYRSLRSRNRNNKLLAAKNAENELLLKEIHHRVKNNLEVVSSLLALQSAKIEDPTTKEAMLAGQNRVHSIGIVHQKLYQGKNLGSIEMKDYFINLSESILGSFGAQHRVEIEFAMDTLDVDIDTAVPLGLIVNELLTNTLKYAFPDSRNGSVRIKLEKKDAHILHLEVSDNGVGKSGVTQGTGFGGQLIALLTRQLNGVMREENNHGTHVFFDFNVAEQR